METALHPPLSTGTIAASRVFSTRELTAIRADFPILGRRVHGHPLVYLDAAATAQRPRTVLDAEREFLERENAAVHRGAHTLAVEATERFEAARERVARFVGADADELVWTSNATEAINLLAYALDNAGRGRQAADTPRLALSPGDEILVTELEHHANLVPWQQLAARSGAILRWVPVDDTGCLRIEKVAELLGTRTRLFAFAHVSNVTGAVQPVTSLVAAARAVGALTLLDASQSAPHLPLDLHALGVDAAVFSGHKMLGPTGIGALYGRRELLEALPPVHTGGSMIASVTMTQADYLHPPHRFEAGTPRLSQAVALAAAVDYLTELDMNRVAAHGVSLGRRLRTGLREITGVRLLGPDEGDTVGLAAFHVDGVHAHDLGQFLDRLGIAVRVGHHCAQPLHRRLGVTASTRASTSVHTTPEEVEALLDAVPRAIAYFRRFR